MGLMICENAGKCPSKKCPHKESHAEEYDCACTCVTKIPGSKCIPYIEPAFDGAPSTLASEQARKPAHVEAIIGKPYEPIIPTGYVRITDGYMEANDIILSIKGEWEKALTHNIGYPIRDFSIVARPDSAIKPTLVAPLTDHAKYCRLSKQPGGLCRWFDKNRCITPMNKFTNYIVDLATDWTICPRPEKQQPVELPKDPLEELCRKQALKQLGETDQTLGDLSEMFREFAEKVRAL